MKGIQQKQDPSARYPSLLQPISETVIFNESQASTEMSKPHMVATFKKVVSQILCMLPIHYN